MLKHLHLFKTLFLLLAIVAGGNLTANAADVIDELTASDFAATGTTYTVFSNVSKTSKAKYAGMSAKDSSGNIQLRSKNSNSGIVSTVSGGKVKSVIITVGSGNNTIDVYGSNTAYTAASDLYNASTQGTKIGSVTATGTIEFTGDYAYVGIRSNNGAIYLSSVEITWTVADPCATPTFSETSGTKLAKDTEVTISSTTTGSTIYYTINGDTPTTSSSHGTDGAASATVTVNDNVTIKAIAVKDGNENSAIATATYTVAKLDNAITVAGGTTQNIALTGVGAITEGEYDLTAIVSATHGTPTYTIKSTTNLTEGTDFDFAYGLFEFTNTYKGIIVVTASVAEDADYYGAEQDITINCSGDLRAPVFTFDNPKSLDNGNSFTIDDANVESDGEITLATSNSSVATVDNVNKEVTAAGVGTCDITVSTSEGTYYAAGSTVFTLNVLAAKGSAENPYTVAEVIDGTATGDDKYVKGFIVGSYNNGNRQGFGRSGQTAANLALADDPDEDDVDFTIGLQLPNGDAVRTNFNTQDKPYNIGVAQVVVCGDITSYIGANGIKSPSSCVKVAEQVKIGSAGMATYYTDAALDYTGLTDMYAYTATVSGDAITFTRINKVPASQGVLLRNPAEAETTQLVPVVNGEAETVTENKFKGTLTDMAALTGENYYILNNGANGLGFYKVKSTGSKVAAHRAYLDASGVSARTFISVDGDTTTGIEAIENVQDVLNSNIFDLQGRRVNVPTKGLYIMNGKKVLFK